MWSAEIVTPLPSSNQTTTREPVGLIPACSEVGTRYCFPALVTIENGIALAALVATTGMPIAVELGLAFDLLIGVALMGIFAGRISQTFDTTNVDHLTGLRDG